MLLERLSSGRSNINSAHLCLTPIRRFYFLHYLKHLESSKKLLKNNYETHAALGLVGGQQRNAPMRANSVSDIRGLSRNNGSGN